jgi:hypothetical protein
MMFRHPGGFIVLFIISLCCGCAVPLDKHNPVVEGLQYCPEPRPEVCTMQYEPVCAALKDGNNQTYSNGCSACIDKRVVGYNSGECR